MTEQLEIGMLEYKGNSVDYIYGKMTCYRDQVLTMADMLRIIGCDFSSAGNDNIERRTNGLQLAESHAENDMNQNKRITELEADIHRWKDDRHKATKRIADLEDELREAYNRIAELDSVLNSD